MRECLSPMDSFFRSSLKLYSSPMRVRIKRRYVTKDDEINPGIQWGKKSPNHRCLSDLKRNQIILQRKT